MQINPKEDKMDEGLPVFDKTLQTTHIWLNEIAADMGCDEGDAWKALTVVLHRLRNRLPLGLAVNLGAQLPILVRGVYYDQFEPNKLPTQCDTMQEFSGKVREWLGDQQHIDPDKAIRAVYAVLTRHLSDGVIGNVVNALPKDLRQAWPQEAQKRASEQEQSGGAQAGSNQQPSGGEGRAMFGDKQPSRLEPASPRAEQTMVGGTDGSGPAR